MKLKKLQPKQSLNKAFLKQRPLRTEIDLFKINLITLLGKIDEIEREENQKNHIRDFLRDTFYKESNEVNTKGSQDLVIHTGKDNKSNVGVIIEAKRPSNKSEWLSAEKPNAKALHELVLYYLRERIEENNIDVKYLIATNIYEWYIIESSYFEKLFFRNKHFVKQYEEWRDGKKVTKDTNLFYNEIVKPYVETLEDEIPCVYFNIKDYEAILKNEDKEDDKNLIALQKILSPFHLLKVPFINDSNSLNEKFYKELLHIIGLEEAKENGKNVIRRKEKNRNPGSIIENTISALETEDPLHKIPDLNVYGENKEERLFNIALELNITWINRILFLKLLEGQLVNYHKGDRQYRFLNSEIIHDFDELFKLFHKVLAVNHHDRNSAIQQKFGRVPYLNSSLFDIESGGLEDLTIKINSLDNSETLDLFNGTVLKDFKKKNDKLPTLDYFFKFLDSFDFASEGTEDIQDDNKSLINASVLGKVFEKINGYKDGSIFTPGFITMYMCRQSIRLAVVEKFREKYKWKIDQFDDIKNYLGDRKGSKDILEFNSLINTLHVCDPAVGSGHFLVSALNELIAIKSELGILADERGIRLADYEIEISNDELFVTDHNGDIFEYRLNNGKPLSKDSQRLQKALFHEKQNLIENCLFGVDINPNSVKICRLRLWIELLKNAYYKEENNFTELETLPNIDINIKCGNSLISRFAIDADLKPALSKSKWNISSYRNAVFTYKNATSKESKRDLLKLINEIKGDFVVGISREDRKVKELNKKKNELFLITTKDKLFETELVKGGKKLEKEKIETLAKEISQLEKAIEDQKNNIIYRNAFEWRFEFPEVLSDKGDYEGFDVIIGNPPYGVSIKGTQREELIRTLGKVPDFEIYYFFINLAKKILRQKGIKSYIIPNTILFNVFAKNYRENLFNNWQIKEVLDCTDFNVFEGSATVRCIVTLLVNAESDDLVYYRPTAEAKSFEELTARELSVTNKEILLANNQNWALVFKLNAETLNIVSKIRKDKKTLADHFPDISQGLIAYDKYQGQDEATIKNRIFHSSKKQIGWKKWLWGEDVTPYMVKWNEKEYINYCKEIANPREPKFFKGERVLVREITNPKIYAGFAQEESYNDPAIINILKNENGEIDLKVLLAVLNSKIATFYHFNSSPKATKGAFPKILVEDIKNFPIPTITKAQQKQLIDLVEKIIEAKSQNRTFSQFEDKINDLVYGLFEITSNEQKTIEGSKK